MRIPTKLPCAVFVTWYDAHHLAVGEWLTDAEVRTDKPLGVPGQTVAWLVAVRDDHLILAHSHDSEDAPGRERHWTGTFCVPVPVVRSISQLVIPVAHRA